MEANMQKPQPSAADAVDPASQLLKDLAILCDGPSVDLQISFDGGLIAMRSHEKLIFQEAAEARWMRMDGAARASLLAGWLRSAAEKYRALLEGRSGEKKKDVA
jgi:hypothetical protein